MWSLPARMYARGVSCARRGPLCSPGDMGIPASFRLVTDREGGWRSQLKGEVCRGSVRVAGGVCQVLREGYILVAEENSRYRKMCRWRCI